MDDPIFEAEKAQAIELFRRFGRASTKLSESPLERKLRMKLGLNGLAGAYLIRSYELMIEQGYNLDETTRRHQEMVDQIRRIMTDFLQESGDDSPHAFPPMPDEMTH